MKIINTYPKIFSKLLSGHRSKSIENYVYVGQRNRPVWYIFEIILAAMAKLLFVMLLTLLIRLLRMFFENIFFNWRDSAVLSSIIFNAAQMRKHAGSLNENFPSPRNTVVCLHRACCSNTACTLNISTLRLSLSLILFCFPHFHFISVRA